MESRIAYKYTFLVRDPAIGVVPMLLVFFFWPLSAA